MAPKLPKLEGELIDRWDQLGYPGKPFGLHGTPWGPHAVPWGPREPVGSLVRHPRPGSAFLVKKKRPCEASATRIGIFGEKKTPLRGIRDPDRHFWSKKTPLRGIRDPDRRFGPLGAPSPPLGRPAGRPPGRPAGFFHFFCIFSFSSKIAQNGSPGPWGALGAYFSLFSAYFWAPGGPPGGALGGPGATLLAPSWAAALWGAPPVQFTLVPQWERHEAPWDPLGRPAGSSDANCIWPRPL